MATRGSSEGSPSGFDSRLVHHEYYQSSRLMNRLSTDQQAQVVAALVEGNSIRATCRMTGAAKGTVLKLLVDLGAACKRYQDEKLRNLTCKRLQCDEIWSFCYAREKNVSEEYKGKLGFGDVWT